MEDKVKFYGDMSLEELHRTFQNDGNKAIYWYNKKMGSDDEQHVMMSRLLNEAERKGLTYASSPTVTYKTKEGRPWMVYMQRNRTTQGMCNHQDYMIAYNDTEDGLEFMYAVTTGEKCGVKNMPTHLFVTAAAFGRWMEQSGWHFKDKLDYIKAWTQQNFMREIVFDKDYISQGTDPKHCYLMFQDGMMVGVVMEESSELNMRKVVFGAYFAKDEIVNAPFKKEGMAEYMRRLHKEVMMNLHNDFFPQTDERKEVAEMYSDEELVFGKDGCRISGDTRTLIRMSACMYRMYKDFMGEYPKQVVNNIDVRILNTIRNNLIKLDVKEPEFVIETIALSFEELKLVGYNHTMNALARSISEKEINDSIKLEDIKKMFATFRERKELFVEYINKIKTIQEQHFTEIMEQKMQTELGAMLKRNGLNKKFEKEIEKMGSLQKAQYLDWVEGIYAISRIIPTVSDDKLRDRLKEVNKEWVALVIDKDLCQQLRPYYERHGKEMVRKAVLYLIDKDAWTSPIADKALKAKQASNYDGLKDIDETVQFLKDEEYLADNDDDNDDDNSNNRNLETSNNHPSEAPADGIASTGIAFDIEAMKATRELVEGRHAYHVAVDALRNAVEQMENLGKVCLNDELVTMLEEDNKRLEAENKDLRQVLNEVHATRKKIDDTYEEQIDKIEADYKKMVSALEDRNTVLAKELDREKKLHKEDNDRNYQNSLAKDKAERELNTLRQQHSKAVADLDALRRAAKEAQETPSVRFISMEELDSLPLMGNKMKSVLIPLLDKHGVKVMTEAEIRKARANKR